MTQPDRDTLARAIMRADGWLGTPSERDPYAVADAVLALLAAGTPTETAGICMGPSHTSCDHDEEGLPHPAPPPAEDTDTLRATLAGICDLYLGSADVPRFSVSDVRAWLNWSPPVRDEGNDHG